jgi:hypothetical protein
MEVIVSDHHTNPQVRTTVHTTFTKKDGTNVQHHHKQWDSTATYEEQYGEAE